ncbi:serine/threonine-protein kinase [Ktedonospora formicarum]|uniref:non-specific serine/threonine protein kinase n=1 Tax=Ktedonospora formicarum TaxID=2778364 RepID=A0A8J3MU89_9CHLR|nr:serine/threonine-protein kinase [Ktedonospora formicarum]GHO49062.1 hypothetical protein KSX_72250 [Ktedonospora formicarum]
MTHLVGRFLGKQLGNYTLTKRLGAGGFAEVYLGLHKHLEMQAAIKVLQAQLSKADQEGFLAEARTVARLRHPHIVRILEFGIEDDTAYLVLNYAAHGTLRHYFERGVPHSPEAILPPLKQIASALQYAHDHGLIHRDIKPENMLLDEQDEVFLSDFGIATQVRNSRSQTVEEITGTIPYMAPEQLRGKPRPASDQYALAIVVYEWLTGTRPFQGESYLAIATQHLTTPPRSLRECVPEISLAVEQVILTALAKDYHRRYARVQDFAEALEQAHLSGRYLSPQDFTPGPVMSESTPPYALVAPYQIAQQLPIPPLGTGSTLAVAPTPDSLAPTRTAPPAYGTLPPQFSPITETPASTQGASYSRRALIGSGLITAMLVGSGLTWWGSTHFAFGTHPDTTNKSQYPSTNDTTITSRFLNQARLLHTYKHTSKLTSVAWSKDSTYVASVEGDTLLHVWNATTGEDLWSISNLSMPQILQIAWSPDGKALAVLENEGSTTNDYPLQMVEIFDTTSHQRRAYFTLPGQHIAWSPDSKFLAVSGRNTSGLGSTLLCIWDGNTNHDPLYTLSVPDAVEAIAWSPDSKQLALGLTNPNGAFSWTIIWTLGSKPDPDPYKHKFDLRNTLGDTATLSWSSTHNTWIASAGSTSVEIWDAGSLGKSYNQNYNQYATPVAWSPDGRYLASATTADQTIRVWNGQDLGLASTCAGHEDTITALAWSPDGRYLASTAGGLQQDQTVRVWQVGN